MIEPNTTKVYDLHLFYEFAYFDQPRVYARQMWLDRDGEWNTDDDDYASYYYTQEDIDWTLNKFELQDLSEIYFDEWFTTDDTGLVELNLPPQVQAWAKTLPAYEYYTQPEVEKELV
jgi:hypothetical protein